MELGSDVLIQNFRWQCGFRPLQVARSQGHPEAEGILIAAEAKVKLIACFILKAKAILQLEYIKHTHI